jgi:hypothetical protein
MLQTTDHESARLARVSTRTPAEKSAAGQTIVSLEIVAASIVSHRCTAYEQLAAIRNTPAAESLSKSAAADAFGASRSVD